MKNQENLSVLLFNPKAANSFRVPNSLLHLAVAIENTADVVFVDGNRETDPWSVIHEFLATGRFQIFGCTVMPGPQLQQAVPITRKVRETFRDVATAWADILVTSRPVV